MNKNLTEKIYTHTSKEESIVLVGPTGSGKTWYVKNELIPYLAKKGMKPQYLDCGKELTIKEHTDIVIIDEVETFFDKEYLEKKHPEESPYYTPKYIDTVTSWHEKLKRIEVPAIYIITRNEKEEIDYLTDNMKTTDWGRWVECLGFYHE